MSVEMDETLSNLEQIEETEMALLEPEIIFEPEVGEVMVFGDPFEVGQSLDDCRVITSSMRKGTAGF